MGSLPLRLFFVTSSSKSFLKKIEFALGLSVSPPPLYSVVTAEVAKEAPGEGGAAGTKAAATHGRSAGAGVCTQMSSHPGADLSVGQVPGPRATGDESFI